MAISDRGFASMPKSKVREIAAKGGRASGRARSKKSKDKNSNNRGRQDHERRGRSSDEDSS